MISKECYDRAIERMARAAVRDSMPTNGMFNGDQLDHMASERMPTYRRIAAVMFAELLNDDSPSEDVAP